MQQLQARLEAGAPCGQGGTAHPASAVLRGLVLLSVFMPWTPNSFSRAGSDATSWMQEKPNRFLPMP